MAGVIKIFVILILILINSGCKTRQGENKSSASGKEIVLRLESGLDNPRNSEGDFITLKDGRLLFVFTRYTGSSDNDNANAYLAGRYSSDQGKSWTTDDKKIVDQEGTMNVMSVSLLRLQNGEIALFYLRKNSETDCIPIIRISDDEAVSWGDPRPCITDKKGYFCLHNNHVIQLSNGRILFAVSEESKLYTDRLWGYYSDDNGRSWRSSAEVPNPDNVLTQEPALVELKNGDIFMLIRTNAGVQYISYSKDKGESWSPSERSKINSPVAPASIARIPSTGDLLLVWDDNGLNQIRSPLKIAISRDEGITWNNIKSIEENPEGRYCYTAIHFTGDNVLLGYTAGSTSKGKNWAVLDVARISLDWIYN